MQMTPNPITEEIRSIRHQLAAEQEMMSLESAQNCDVDRLNQAKSRKASATHTRPKSEEQTVAAKRRIKRFSN